MQRLAWREAQETWNSLTMRSWRAAEKDMKGRASGEGLGWHSAAGGCCNQEFEAQPWFAAFGELCFFDL